MKRSLPKCVAAVAVLGALILAASSGGTLTPGPPPTAPVRSTYQDVSLKLLRTPWGSQYPYMYLKGRVATQVGRDDMEATLTALAVPEAYRYARSMAACASSMGRIVSLFNNITAKLGPGYEFKSILSHGTWFIPASGRHYSDERYTLKTVRDCSTSGGAKECAKNPLMTAALRDLLDLTIVNGQ